jgi:hypothetical protein
MSLIELGEEDKPWLGLRFISKLNVLKSSTEPFAAAVTAARPKTLTASSTSCMVVKRLP